MGNNLQSSDVDEIKTKIYTIRGLQVMLDTDLAKLYSVETKQLNRAVKRNKERFPDRFMFQLTDKEHNSLRFHTGTLNLGRGKNVSAIIFTKEIAEQLILDLKKCNQQYPQIQLKEFKLSHDRFLIIDDKDVYHFGASLKDLGKRWFAFSKFDKEAFNLLDRLGLQNKNP